MPLAGGDGDVDGLGDSGDGVDVFGRDGVFVKEQIVVFERAAEGNRVAGSKLGRAVHVDHEIDFGADFLADRLDAFDAVFDAAGFDGVITAID